MAYFRERNNIKSEYSGYQQASKALRDRLYSVIDQRSGYNIGVGNESFYLQLELLDHETLIRLGMKCLDVIRSGAYEEVFEAAEIFLSLVRRELYQQAFDETKADMATAFQTAGSVYEVNRSGQIVLKLSEETAKNIETTDEQLAVRSADALDFFRRAYRDLLTRARNPNDIVKDFAVALEDYLIALTNKKDYKEAIRFMRDQNIIAPLQQGVLEKLYAYRGDAQGVAHSGNTEEPGEVDAVWFLETFVAQVRLIEAKMRDKNPLEK